MTLRNRELAALLTVGALTAIGFATVYIALKSQISGGSLGYAVFFFGLYLVAHVVARLTVPLADPYLLPMAALLTAIGVTEIYRLGPSNAFRQGLWVVIGVGVFAATLFWLRHDYRVLERYKYVFGVTAIFLLLLPWAPGHRGDDQRLAALDPLRRRSSSSRASSGRSRSSSSLPPTSARSARCWRRGG